MRKVFSLVSTSISKTKRLPYQRKFHTFDRSTKSLSSRTLSLGKCKPLQFQLIRLSSGEATQIASPSLKKVYQTSSNMEPGVITEQLRGIQETLDIQVQRMDKQEAFSEQFSLAVMERLADQGRRNTEVMNLIKRLNNGATEQKTSSAEDRAQYIIPLEQPVVTLDCDNAFNNLTDKEKLYSHYLSKACWTGGLITTVQTSIESPVVLGLLHDLFTSNGIEGLKNIAINKCSFTEDEWKALLVYTTALFGNAGNYKSFGDTKIIPGLSLYKFDLLIREAKLRSKELLEDWREIKHRVYSLSERDKQLGLGEKGITTYFSDNCTSADAEFLNRFMKSVNIEAYITRAFKTVVGNVTHYEIRSASVDQNDTNGKVYDFEGAKVTFTRGDYSPLLASLVQYLKLAKEYCANETERQMIEKYIESFQVGSLQAHIEGSRHWVHDQGPAIETYLGFIETYRDPAGTRGEFEGFVSVVNRPMSEKFTVLVDSAQIFLPLLPWPNSFERETFIKPDFTSLDVLTFSGSGIPAGINIPNYDSIRHHEGFKNVSLGNVIPANYKDSKIPFLSESDKELFNKYRIPSFEVQVGLHELLGHGSGKLFTRKKDSKAGEIETNFSSDLRNPLDNSQIDSVYEDGDTYDSVFTTLGSAYEECRAESVGIYLSLDSNVLKIFGFEGEEAQKVKYVNWLSMVFAGAKSLEMYQPATNAWLQAHSQARFVILQVLLEAGEGLVTVEKKTGEDGQPDLLISMDESKIDTVGRKAMSDFLLKLQVYKSTANIKAARAMFDKYSAVNNDGKYPWASWRNIVMDKRQPRKIFVQHNTILGEDNTVKIATYDPSPEGMIQSWIERYSPEENIYSALDYCYRKDKPHF